MRYKSLNESILSVTNPQPKVSSSLVEEQKYIEEYIAMLESALESIAKELECDVEDLLEDYQTRERDRQMANTGQLGSSLDSKEKASKKVYGKDGVVAHKSLRSMIKKANWKGLENEKNRLAQRFADPNKTSSFENR